MPKVQFIGRKSFERDSNRPYATLLYCGYTFLDSTVYDRAYFEPKYDRPRRIHKIAVCKSLILIIYEDF